MYRSITSCVYWADMGPPPRFIAVGQVMERGR